MTADHRAPERGGPPGRPESPTTITQTDNPTPEATGRFHYAPAHSVADMARRRAAARRLPALACGCRDPLAHRCTASLTEHSIGGATDAARHLLGIGYPPLLGIDTIRAVWRHGDRALAQTLYELAGGESA